MCIKRDTHTKTEEVNTINKKGRQFKGHLGIYYTNLCIIRKKIPLYYNIMGGM
jgi:hypothetical protein